jgi:hypothetical protein
MDKLKIEYVNIDSIKPYKNNAKQHPKEQIEQIKKSIEKFEMIDPIGIWNNEIVEGHGRLIACKELGMKEVPIIRLDHLSDEERKAYTLAHNKLTMNSDFNADILGEELDSIINIDMSQFGFDEIIESIGEEKKESAEVEFSEVLGEEHNYIVLYFDNDVDWIQAETLFDIKPVKCGSTRKDGKITKNMNRMGIGRVINGAKALNKILGDKL